MGSRPSFPVRWCMQSENLDATIIRGLSRV